MERVAVLGLGRMGSAIAVRLAGAGMRVTGWNRSPRSVGGVPVAASLAEAVEEADVLVLSLFDDAAVREVLGLLAALPLSGRLVADTSTVAPDVMPGAAPALEAAGAAAVDAPISGGPEMVAAGRAGMFLGGAPEDVGRLAPIAAHLAAQAPHVGPLGAGAAAKVVNNMVLCGMWQTLKEALLTGTTAGVWPVEPVDGRKLGSTCPGPISKRLQERFLRISSGEDPAFEHWLTVVEPA